MKFKVSMSDVTGSVTFKAGSRELDVTSSGTYTITISGSGSQCIEFDTFEVGSMTVSLWKLIN